MMFGTASAFLAALEAQVAAQEGGGVPPRPGALPLGLLVGFRNRASLRGYEDARQVSAESFGASAILLRYDGWRIPHLYVDPSAPNYEALYVRHVLSAMLPQAEHAAVLSGRNVDHVLPRTAAGRNGVGFVLLLPCDETANKSAGGGLERRLNTDWGDAGRDVWLADFIVLAKLAGVLSASIANTADLDAEAARLSGRLAQRYLGEFQDDEASRRAIRSYLDWVKRQV